MMKKIVLLISILFLVSYVSADFGIDNSNLPRIERQVPTIVNINQSNVNITNINVTNSLNNTNIGYTNQTLQWVNQNFSGAAITMGQVLEFFNGLGVLLGTISGVGGNFLFASNGSMLFDADVGAVGGKILYNQFINDTDIVIGSLTNLESIYFNGTTGETKFNTPVNMTSALRVLGPIGLGKAVPQAGTMINAEVNDSTTRIMQFIGTRGGAGTNNILPFNLDINYNVTGTQSPQLTNTFSSTMISKMNGSSGIFVGVGGLASNEVQQNLTVNLTLVGSYGKIGAFTGTNNNITFNTIALYGSSIPSANLGTLGVQKGYSVYSNGDLGITRDKKIFYDLSITNELATTMGINIHSQTYSEFNTTFMEHRNFINGIFLTKLNTTHFVMNGTIDSQNYSARGIYGLSGTYQVLKDVDLVGLTKTFCNQTFTGGILTSTNC